MKILFLLIFVFLLFLVAKLIGKIQTKMNITEENTRHLIKKNNSEEIKDSYVDDSVVTNLY